MKNKIFKKFKQQDRIEYLLLEQSIMRIFDNLKYHMIEVFLLAYIIVKITVDRSLPHLILMGFGSWLLISSFEVISFSILYKKLKKEFVKKVKSYNDGDRKD